MASQATANTAQANLWRGLLTTLECWVLICGPDDLPDEAWNDMGADLDALAPGIARNAGAIRAAGEAALLAHPAPAAAVEQEQPVWPVPPPQADIAPPADTTSPAEHPAPEPAHEDPVEADLVVPGPDDTDRTGPADDVVADPEPASGPVPEETDDAEQPEPEQPATETVLAQPVAAPPRLSVVADVASGPSAKPMRWVDIAEAVLTAAGRELTAREILDWSLAHGPSRPVTGKTPTQTINRDLHNAIRKGHPKLRRGSRQGTFTLA